MSLIAEDWRENMLVTSMRFKVAQTILSMLWYAMPSQMFGYVTRRKTKLLVGDQLLRYILLVPFRRILDTVPGRLTKNCITLTIVWQQKLFPLGLVHAEENARIRGHGKIFPLASYQGSNPRRKY